MRREPIAPNLAPDGLVFQLWNDNQMLREDRVTGDQIGEVTEILGAEAGDQTIALLEAGASAVELRCYDGDDGVFVGSHWVGLL